MISVENFEFLVEGSRLEFKELLPDDDKLEKTVIAFCNGAGGEIILGVSDSPREVKGLEENEIFLLEERISNRIYDTCQPVIPFLISLLNVDEKYLLKVKVFPGNRTPYFIKKKGVDQGTYIRVGSTNRLADSDIIKSLERRSQNISFDSLPCHADEFSPDSLEDFVQTYFNATTRALDHEGFQKTGLMLKHGDNILPTNAAILLSTSGLRNRIFPYV